jgi:hypothetical protein
MQDRPTAAELLVTLGEYLDEEVLPSVEGALRYKTLVAANLLKILERELAAGDAPVRAERDRLAALLGVPAGEDDPSAAVERLNGALQRRLLDPEPPGRAFLLAARDALELSVLDKLAVNKPGYDRYDQAVEVV